MGGAKRYTASSCHPLLDPIFLNIVFCCYKGPPAIYIFVTEWEPFNSHEVLL